MKVASPLGKTETAVAQKELENFQENTKGVTSAVLLSADGFEVASLQVNKDSASRLALSLFTCNEATSNPSALSNTAEVTPLVFS